MAARNVLRSCCGAGGLPYRTATAAHTSVRSSVSRFPLSTFFSTPQQFSSDCYIATDLSYDRPHCSFALSAPRRAGQPPQEHHAVHHVVPRYTDDIPAEYYGYGASKNFKNDSSIVPGLVRSGAALGIAFALCILNVKWSCEHWHYKHRLAGSYLESE